MSPQTAKLTRRGILTGAAAAGASVILGPAAARAALERERVWVRWTGSLRGESPPIAAGRRFALAGVQWSGPAAARIELRTRRQDGRWSAWALASVQGHDPDGTPRSATRFGEPIWSGSADLIQLRSARPVHGVRIHFVARPGQELLMAASTALDFSTPLLAAGPGQPAIIARSSWAAQRATPAGPPSYGVVRLAFVHHTDNPNGYSPADVPSLLLAIFDYHRFVRGYRDIAYNFIIDAYGGIWEGRAGGIDQPVLGAHAGGYNAVSTGVAVLGKFMSSVPPPSALYALERLLAWKLSLHGRPTLGTVALRVNPSGASYTPFAPGQLVHLNRISGHRDGDLTDCPGNAFYAQLPLLRALIAGLTGAPAKLTLTSPGPAVGAGAVARLRGNLVSLNGSAPLAGAPVEIQRMDGGGATTIGTAVTDATGAWSSPLTISRGAVVRALHRPAPACVSDLVAIEVVPRLTLRLSSSSPPRVSGTITPAKAAVTLDTYQLVGGRRVPLRSQLVRTRSGRFSARLPGARRGRRLVVVARSTEGGGTLAGQSRALQVNPR